MSMSRRRGEGYVEYVVIVCMIMVCAVVGFLRAGSGAIDRIASSKALCAECPDALLQGSDLDDYHRLRAARERAHAEGTTPFEGSAEDRETFERLAALRRDDLEARRAVGALTEDEARELSELNTFVPERPTPTDGSGGANPAPRPGVLGMFDNIFGRGWEDTWVASLMGIFGWFSFFA
ncbi:MAG: hypothetical protein KF878_21350 [Planctomycetes bacterium]|nr:hypothetical protein [Planctomycetota bacterium]